MKRFSDFAKDTVLDGDKIRIDDVINQEIEVINFTIKSSRYSRNKSGRYLTLQVITPDERRHVLFTGSDVLIDQLEKYGDEIPFMATIRKINRYYSLS